MDVPAPHMCYLSFQVWHSRRTSVPLWNGFLWLPAPELDHSVEIPHAGVSVFSLVHLSGEQSTDSGNFLVEDTPDICLYSKVSIHKYFRKKIKQTSNSNKNKTQTQQMSVS